MNLKQINMKRRLITFVIICAISMAAWLYIDSILFQFNQYRLVKNDDQSTNKSDTNETRYILLWNKFFDDKRWMLLNDINDPLYFRNDLKCPVFNCVVTNQRDVLPKTDMYDAILFHTARPFSNFDPIPKSRSWKQLYVFALMESPGSTKHNLSDERDFYNLTMTYRMDSDILWPYDWLVDKATEMRVIPREYPKWYIVPNSHNETSIWKLWPYKNKLAAWFVSNCKTKSRREKLVKKLQKYIDVDVFGKCGPKKCQRFSSECDKILDENYKFYFSFENNLCVDYITEKLYNSMRRNIIPVVYGGADYKRFLPPHSYINVEDYETPQDLANYLKYLSKNPDEYMRYFWWRQHYNIKSYSPFCDLCKLLHESNYLEKTHTYLNIEKWWFEKSCRLQSRIKF